MRKILVVAVREYQAAVKSKAFIISLVAMPVIWGGSIAVQMLLRNKVDVKDKHVGVVDYTDRLYDAVAAAAQTRNESVQIGEGRRERDNGIYETDDQGVRKQVRPKYILEKCAPTSEDPERVVYDLSERVRKKELFAFVVIGPDVMQPGLDPVRGSVAYHSNSPTYDDIQDWVAGPITRRVQELRFQAFNLNADVVGKATQPTPVGNLGLVSLDARGRVTKAEVTNELANVFVPLGLMMLMLMVIMVGASPLVQSVLEEKMARIAEVLLGSIPPFELMLGKLLGMVGVSLTIATIYLAGAYYAIHRTQFAPLFPAHLLWWFVVFVALAVLMYGAIFAAIGAAVSDLKEAQSILTPVMVIAVSPMFVWINVVREPSSTMSLVLSLIPPATPMLMTIRQAVPPGIPVWQPLLGVLLVLLATIACVFVAGRVFRVGILMQGKGAKVSEMMRWVFRG